MVIVQIVGVPPDAAAICPPVQVTVLEPFADDGDKVPPEHEELLETAVPEVATPI